MTMGFGDMEPPGSVDMGEEWPVARVHKGQGSGCGTKQTAVPGSFAYRGAEERGGAREECGSGEACLILKEGDVTACSSASVMTPSPSGEGIKDAEKRRRNFRSEILGQAGGVRRASRGQPIVGQEGQREDVGMRAGSGVFLTASGVLRNRKRCHQRMEGEVWEV